MWNRRIFFKRLPEIDALGYRAPCQGLYPEIMRQQTIPSKNHFTSTTSGGFVMIKPDGCDDAFKYRFYRRVID
jgi:hypothetical protein